MKNLYSKTEFLNLRGDGEMINEGFFQFLGKMFNKAKAYINKIRGGKEVEKIYLQYKNLIEQEFKKKAKVDLQLGAEEQLEKPNDKKEKQLASYKYKGAGSINEADITGTSPTGATTVAPTEPTGQVGQSNQANSQKQVNTEKQDNEDNKTNVKMTAKTLKEKQLVLQQILDKYKNIALKQMGQILSKYGGAEKNPKLARIIDNKKDEFDLEFLNAKIKYLEQGGDKIAANKLATERNRLAKELDAKWNLDKVEQIEIDVDGTKFKVGTPYRYKTENGIRTIKISKKSEEPGKVSAHYVSGKRRGMEQNFRIENIEKDEEFKPNPGEKFNYFNEQNNKVVEVEVVSVDNNGTVDVKVGGNKFKVPKGALMDIPENNA